VPPLNTAQSAFGDVEVRRLFGGRPRPGSFIAGEVARRMAGRLDYIRLEPREVVDAHSHPGSVGRTLSERFPAARLTAVHLAMPASGAQSPGVGGALARVRQWLGPRRGELRVLADLDRLPFRPGTLQLIWSNLALHWHPRPHEVFPAWRGALAVGGLVMFSAFGPDTLREVRSAFRAIDAAPHVIDFTDMHDYGDMLVEAGFVTPVVDMETITLTYASEAKLWDDVRALGGNPLALRRRGLLGRGAAARLSDALRAQGDPDGRLRLTFEVVYGHAWKGAPRPVSDGTAPLRRMAPPRAG